MSKSYSIPHLHASGTHYEVGYQTGITFKDRIEKYLDDFTEFREKIVPFIETENGKKILEVYLKNQETLFPWYVDEIRGLSDGSGISFLHLFAINLRVELMHLCYPGEVEVAASSGKECSDFHLVNNSNHLLIHNEDSSASVYHTGYLVTFKVTSRDYGSRASPNEEFTCYCYPGQLPGNAFGHNAKGFVFGVNALYPKLVVLDKTPRQIVNRVMMGANTLEELENMFLNIPISYGVSLNVSCCTNDLSILKTSWNNEYNTDAGLTGEVIYPISWNYEIGPTREPGKANIVSKHCIIPRNIAQEKKLDLSKGYFTVDYLPHFNHYNRIAIEECIFISRMSSSKHREARERQLPDPKTRQDLIELASDTGDPELPIYREINPTDTAKTVATALYDIQNSNVTIYFGKPSGGYELLMKLAL